MMEFEEARAAIAHLGPYLNALVHSAEEPNPTRTVTITRDMAKAIIALSQLARLARNMEETIDNVREALGIENTHYLVLADQVSDVVKALEVIAADDADYGPPASTRASTALTKLREAP